MYNWYISLKVTKISVAYINLFTLNTKKWYPERSYHSKCVDKKNHMRKSVQTVDENMNFQLLNDLIYRFCV